MSFTGLPADLLLRVADSLRSVQALGALAAVSKACRQAAANEEVWRELCSREGCQPALEKLSRAGLIQSYRQYARQQWEACAAVIRGPPKIHLEDFHWVCEVRWEGRIVFSDAVSMQSTPNRQMSDGGVVRVRPPPRSVTLCHLASLVRVEEDSDEWYRVIGENQDRQAPSMPLQVDWAVHRRSDGKRAHLFGSCLYACNSWEELCLPLDENDEQPQHLWGSCQLSFRDRPIYVDNFEANRRYGPHEWSLQAELSVRVGPSAGPQQDAPVFLEEVTIHFRLEDVPGVPAAADMPARDVPVRFEDFIVTALQEDLAWV